MAAVLSELSREHVGPEYLCECTDLGCFKISAELFTFCCHIRDRPVCSTSSPASSFTDATGMRWVAQRCMRVFSPLGKRSRSTFESTSVYSYFLASWKSEEVVRYVLDHRASYWRQNFRGCASRCSVANPTPSPHPTVNYAATLAWRQADCSLIA